MAAKKDNRKKQKGIIIALVVAVVIAFLALCITLSGLFIFRDSVYLGIARSEAKNEKFSSAAQWVERSSHDDAQALGEYINLRLDINEKYPLLLSEFDITQIKQWHSSAEYLSGCTQALGGELCAQAQGISQSLSVIIKYEEEYSAIKTDILSLMDIFNEINRLHTKGEDGKNIVFTIEEERAKIETWAELSENVIEFTSSVPGNENIYLLNYMVKESQGEISELTDAINSVAESGYSITDNVRFSGDAEKKFPDITNSNGATVNLLDKTTYETYMYNEFCSCLVKNISVYYVNNN